MFIKAHLLPLNLFFLFFFSLQGVCATTNVVPAQEKASLETLTDRYFDYYFSVHPTSGTSVGLHQYDNQFEHFSQASIQQDIQTLKNFEHQFSQVPTQSLTLLQKQDLALVLSDIRGQLLNLETIRQWEKNPDIYSSALSYSAFTLISRQFAPAEERLKTLIAREKQMPKALAAARENLKNPPPEFTEIALAQLPDIITFFEKDVPEAFATVKNKALLAEFKKTNTEVIAQLKHYQQWVQETLKPLSKGDFRIGAATFSQKLLYDEMVDTPVEKILALGEADLRKNQAAFAKVARTLSPDKTPQEVLLALGSQHPPVEKLLTSFKETFASLIGFIKEKQIIAIPSSIQPTLEETPPFMRATTFASMDTPGPYEKKATEAFFNVTLPEPSWNAAEVEEYMRMFNVGTITGTAIHEAYPGHYVQFLWVQHAPSKVRKLLGAMTNAEGWAHYCEQMMLDEGYGQPGMGAVDKKQTLQIQLGQLQNALLRDARLIVGIKMHTGQMSFQEGADFFVTEGYQSASNGRREALRGTYNPTYLYYTLGKLQILKLREDLRQKQGQKFSLEGFHNAFMQQGFPPIKIVRETLLGENSPSL